MSYVFEIVQGVVLGVIQGVGEFLPISSSGHLVVLPLLLGWEYQGVGFDVMLHGGTLIALCVYFRRDIVELGRAGLFYVADYRKGITGYRRLLSMIIIGTFPAVAAALLFDDMLTVTARHPVVTAFALILMGIVLWIADRSVKAKGSSLALMRWGQAIFIGLFQALSLIPGVSRSGSTITAALLLGYSRKDAARFSFLLSIPVILGALVFSIYDFVKEGFTFTIGMVVGAVVAGVIGYIVISFLLKFVEKYSYRVFVIYRILLGLGILVWWYFQ